MKLRFKQRLFLYFTVIFSIFTVWIYFFERSHDQQIKTEALGEKLNIYTQLIATSLDDYSLTNTKYFPKLKKLNPVLPAHIRITLINPKGRVIYDNSIKHLHSLGNHLHRSEIQEALNNGTGEDIRVSVSNQEKYFYFARKSPQGFIRVALPYNVEIKSALQPDSSFFYFLIIAYCSILILINWVANRFGRSIKQLRDFAIAPSSNQIFSSDELGEIGQKITENYQQLIESKNQIDIEREKLLQHVQSSKEGICFFSAKKTVKFYNGLFIQYINLITDETESEPMLIFKDQSFKPLHNFLKGNADSLMAYKIKKQGKVFSVRVVLFENQSFEVILNDITKQEKTLQLKQEMTSNIAHELRTPITGIRGYLETILSTELSMDKKQHFIQQAYKQTKTLSEIVQDMSLISKIEEVGHSFKIESINITEILLRIKDDFSITTQEKGININLTIPQNTMINGNPNLIYSIFKNLIDNSIRYAGDDIDIFISLYKQDTSFLYFSFYDTGSGIKDEYHLPRLFERFYRIGEGRTRESGGSGLGLSIVKNAVLIHGGIISAKNRKEGGLEFLFELRR